MEEWIDVTTVDQYGVCLTEISIFTNQLRHKKNFNGDYGEWVYDTVEDKQYEL